MIVSILVFLLSLSAVILIHEFGHFLMARRAGILCHEFSIGMGPVVWSTKKGETVYSVRAIPIGGYVAMAGEEVDNQLVKVGSTIKIAYNEDLLISEIILNADDPKFDDYETVVVDAIDLRGKDGAELHINHIPVKEDAMYVLKDNKKLQIAPYNRDFESKTVWQRFLAIFAGPFMNFVLALIVFIGINLFIGAPDMDSSELGSITENYPSEGVLEAGDTITSIDGTSVSTWDEVTVVLDQTEGDRELVITYTRDDSTYTSSITPAIYFYNVGFHSAEGDIDDLIIGEVPEGVKADTAGFEAGDQILSIDGVELTSWQEVIDIMVSISNEDYDENRVVEFEMMRDGEVVTLSVSSPYSQAFLESQNLSVYDTFVGIGPVYGFDLGTSLSNGFSQLENSAMIIFTTIELLFDNDGAGAGIGVDSLSGPVGIFQITASALEDGLLSLFSWIGLLSVNLGIINLLPIPALDGGRLVFLAYEAITRRKPNKKIENTLHYVMYLALMGLFVYITFNDILRLFR